MKPLNLETIAMRPAYRLPYFGLAVLLLAMVSAQIMLAGLSLFWESSVWDTHAGLGHLVPLIPFVLLILALAGRLPLHLRAWSGVLLGATLVQTELFAVLHSAAPASASYHPLLAALLLWGSIVVTQRSWVLWRRPQSVGASVNGMRVAMGEEPTTTCPVGDPDCHATA